MGMEGRQRRSGRRSPPTDRPAPLGATRCPHAGPPSIPLALLYFASSPVKDTTLEKAARSGLGFACRSGTFSMRSSLTGFRRSVADRHDLKDLGRSRFFSSSAEEEVRGFESSPGSHDFSVCGFLRIG
jgi:hypothetical protein